MQYLSDKSLKKDNNMKNIKVTIDKKEVEVKQGTTILDAAKSVGITIPTLCYLHLKDFNITNRPAGCRICVVEVEGRRNLAPACATECTEGMVINTHNIRVLNARKTVLELILSDHPTDCLICAKSGNCELQTLAHEFGIREIEYQGEQSTYKKDMSPSIIRDVDKCIMCRRCEMMCNEIQTVGALSAVNRGFTSVVAPAFEQDLSCSPCTYCGQCVAVCPTGALTEVDHTNQIIRLLADPTKTVVVQTAPAVRAALGEEFGLKPGTSVTGKMVSALRELGFDYVFDTDFAADLTIMEEGSELLDRIARYLKGDTTVKLPILTSCCPGWVNFFEHQFPDMLDVPSTARSPQQMFGSIAKTYFADKLKIKRQDMVVVSIMPCLAKKFERSREEFSTDGNPDVDFSLSTRELAQLIKQANINFNALPESDYDAPLGESTGAAVIFGASGGVIEAATRTAYEIFTGKTLEKVDFTELRGLESIREATVDFNGTPIKIGIAHGLGNARKLLERVRAGNSGFHAIEIMACPGGCIGGGGQPLHHGDSSILFARQKAIYDEDKSKAIRKSHENPYIQKLYKEFLGAPLSEKSHHLLHTHYFDKKKVIEIDE
jgi:NADP-reducing hydrogenase subunit HndD